MNRDEHALNMSLSFREYETFCLRLVKPSMVRKGNDSRGKTMGRKSTNMGVHFHVISYMWVVGVRRAYSISHVVALNIVMSNSIDVTYVACLYEHFPMLAPVNQGCWEGTIGNRPGWWPVDNYCLIYVMLLILVGYFSLRHYVVFLMFIFVNEVILIQTTWFGGFWLFYSLILAYLTPLRFFVQLPEKWDRIW